MSIQGSPDGSVPHHLMPRPPKRLLPRTTHPGRSALGRALRQMGAVRSLSDTPLR